VSEGEIRYSLDVYDENDCYENQSACSSLAELFNELRDYLPKYTRIEIIVEVCGADGRWERAKDATCKQDD